MISPSPTFPARDPFFVAGGTLRYDALSYVERDADQELYDALRHGEFCYVLTSRQMGKSSLMVRTALRLRRSGVRVATLDLTAVGLNVSPLQWYRSLLQLTGDQLGQTAEMLRCWNDHPELGPLDRLVRALTDVATQGPEQPAGEAHESWSHAADSPSLVLFIDEIDAVRSLPFSADEFFAAIRRCHNRRSEEAQPVRLAFCLLGVASPAQLITNPEITPFNIGRRVELTDFTVEEASPLAAGLAAGLAKAGITAAAQPGMDAWLLHRILHWTGGHPYLTQALCRAVAGELRGYAPHFSPRAAERLVDAHCAKLFLSPSARERDDNLAFVRDRLLADEKVLTALLELYAAVRSGGRVIAQEGNALVSALRLAGVVRADSGYLRLRNRIYAQVFDHRWIVNHTPLAEQRRQQAAFRRGVLRTGSVSVAIVAALGTLTWRAIHGEQRAAQQTQRAEEREARRHRTLYAAQMNLASQALAEGNPGRAWELIAAQLPQPAQDDLRGFEWRYLWGWFQDARATLREHRALVFSTAFSRDGAVLASGSFDGSVALWDPRTGKLLRRLGQHSAVTSAVFSPDGQLLASAGEDGTICLWDYRTGQLRRTLEDHLGSIMQLTFSPDGRLLAGGGDSGIVRVWDMRQPASPMLLRGHTATVNALTFCGNRDTLASGSSDRTVRFWDMTHLRETGRLPLLPYQATSLAVDPAGKTLAVGDHEGTVCLWDIPGHRSLRQWRAHVDCVQSLRFSPDGKRLGTVSWDQAVKLWDRSGKHLLASLHGHIDRVNCIAFSPGGERLATGSNDRTVKIWDLQRADTPQTMRFAGNVRRAAFLRDGRRAAVVAGGHSLILVDTASRRRLRTIPGEQLAVSSDGRWLATGDGKQGTVEIWDESLRHRCDAFRIDPAGYSTMQLSPDGSLLAVGSQSRKSVLIWDLGAHRLQGELFAHDAPVGHLAFSPSGDLLAAAAESGVAIYRRGTRGFREEALLRGHSNAVTALCFTPDGRRLVTGSWDRTLLLWDTRTWKKIGPFWGHRRELSCLAMSPDGRTLVSGSEDGTVKWWNLATMQELNTVSAHRGWMGAAAFSPDGTVLVTGGSDGRLRFWQAPPLSQIEAAGAIQSSGPVSNEF